MAGSLESQQQKYFVCPMIGIDEVNERIYFDSFSELVEFMAQTDAAPCDFEVTEWTDKAGNQRRGRRKSHLHNKPLGLNVLVYDVDEGASLDETIDRLFELPYKFGVYTSKSHQVEKGEGQPACDRFRIVFALEDIIDDDADYKATWSSMLEELPFVDKSCKNISRFYYAGQEFIGAREEGTAIPIVKGAPINTQKTIDQAPKEAARERVATGVLSKTTQEFIINFAPPGQRHNAHFAALCNMRECGWSYERALKKSKAIFKEHDVKWSNTEQKRIDDAYTRPLNGGTSTAWPKVMVRNNKTIPDPNAEENYYHLFGNRLNIQFRWNELEGTAFYVNGKGGEPKYVDDNKLSHVSIEARSHGLIASKDVINDYINRAALNNSYHPVREAIEERLRRAPVDGYINTLCSTLEYDLDDSLTKDAAQQRVADYHMLIKKWIVGAVAKLYHPGTSNAVLVLKGGQGVGKTRWFAALTNWGNDATGEGPIDFTDKDRYLIHLAKFIWRLDELDYVTSKTDASKLKQYVDQAKITVRPSYARKPRTGYSICSFCGTVNEEIFLNDYTGNRRYWLVPICDVNPDHGLDTLGVFAEAKKLLDEGYRPWLSDEELERINAYNEEYEISDQVDDIVASIVGGDDFMAATEIFKAFGFRPRSEMKAFSKLRKLLRRKKITYKRRNNQRGYLVDKAQLLKT